MTVLELECITTGAALAELEDEWRALWRRAPDATPFQHPAWQLAWWSQFGGDRLLVAVLRERGRLAGLLAAYVLDGAKLLPVGAGLSDWLDALIAPDAPCDTAARLLSTVLAQAGEVARCDLIDLPPASKLRDCDPPRHWQAALHITEPCPVLLLANGQDALRDVPATARRKLRMNRHRADRAGGWSVELARADTVEPMMDMVLGLHAARWDGKGQPGGVLADPRVRATLLAAAPSLLADGALRVAVLRVAGGLAAGCVALLTHDRLMLYLGGFAAEHASCSPGSLLVAALAEQAAAEGRRELHFLRGGEAYKYAWGATDRHNATRTLRRL